MKAVLMSDSVLTSDQCEKGVANNFSGGIAKAAKEAGDKRKALGTFIGKNDEDLHE